MASNIVREESLSLAGAGLTSGASPALASLHRVLTALASLRLTVTLFVLSIFLIFAGTLAQVDQDIWDVMNQYFRAWIAWVPFQIFFPPAFFPRDAYPLLGHVGGGFYFPGGFLIGITMAVNLLAAHGVRFTVQARGTRLVSGLIVIGLGVALTWLVVMGGSEKEIVEGSRGLQAGLLWAGVKLALAALWLTIAAGLWRTPADRKIERWGLTALGLIVGGVLGSLVYYGSAFTPDDSAMRILWQLITATSAALVLLAGCVLVFRKRAGVVLLHAGIGLLMVNELVVYSLHSEGVMRLSEGETTHYAEDIRSVELALVRPVDAAEEDVTVVPRARLVAAAENQSKLADSQLPCDLEVTAYFPNANVRVAGPFEPNRATAGEGLKAIAEERRRAAGVDMSKEVDLPAAYVKLIDRASGQPIGTYLTSIELNPQTVEIDGKKFELSLRFKRDYKPYAVTLLDVSKKDYAGTSTPRDYSSDVQVVDAAHGVDRKVHIWMNNPLRFAGDTLYQSNYANINGREISTLQVVKNTGWMIPYVACMIVVVGLVSHFGQALLRFLQRQDAKLPDAASEAALAAKRSVKARRAETATAGRPARWQQFLLPACVVLFVGGWLASEAREPRAKPGEFHFYEFGKLPVLYEGRVKPIDTLARNSLQILSGRQTYLDSDGKRQPAVRWLLDAVTRSERSADQRIFNIYDPQVVAAFGLTPRADYLYSANDLKPKLKEFEAEAKAAHEKDVRALSSYEKKLLELDKKLHHYLLLLFSFEPPDIRQGHELEDLLAARDQGESLKKMQVPLVVPPADKSDEWEPFPTAWARSYAARVLNKEPKASTLAWENILSSYAADKPAEFDRAVANYRGSLAADPPPEVKPNKVDFEAFFNHFEPFFWLWILDLAALVLVIFSWLGYRRVLNRTAFWLLCLTLTVHTLGLVARMYISGRPPVTNLYSSALFIGWGCMVFGLIFEMLFRLGIGNLLAAVAGFASLRIAHSLSGDGDTLIVMQAVLDTQFWLATHVVCITMGYAATFVAGILGIIYVFFTMFNALSGQPRNPELEKDLNRMIYGTVCFALLFSFFGTVLGGLWADDSWGRFWGWDPKENGALIIVIWNALVLHARWGGMVRQRGLAILAMGGNIVTAWSWFGVNQLGAGLHSYGFTAGVALALAIGIGIQLAIIAVGIWGPRRAELSPG